MTDRPRLAVSNIAWDPSEDDDVGELLRREGVGGIEFAPTKWRERPLNASGLDIAACRRAWEDRGLQIVSLQSLLYGRPDLQLFGDETHRTATVDYLRRVIDLAAALGAHALVFGSPKNRTRGDMSPREAMSIAVDVLHELAVHAHDQGTIFCVEANPPSYACDFITTTAEAVALCAKIDHPGLRINADLGGITISAEDPNLTVFEAGDWIAHFHASEPELSELGTASDHTRAAEGLVEIGYRGWVSIEMRTVVPFASPLNTAAIERAVRIAKTAYARVI